MTTLHFGNISLPYLPLTSTIAEQKLLQLRSYNQSILRLLFSVSNAYLDENQSIRMFYLKKLSIEMIGIYH